ncbi:MAG: Amuc_1100 family pilus-like protein, partial [Kiritimatiellae bacterium]|nr:Amuc_1100 family pilus-like protein [Kiritimatiellia bacterium]
YAVGQLPASGDIPGLVQQLKIIEALCDILREAEITELVAIGRENFEQASRGAEASGGRRGAPPPEAAGSAPGDNKMVYRQHFEISIKSRENAVIAMLNLLASRPMFMVVTRVEMINPRQEYSAGGPAPAAASAPGAPGATAASSALERQVILGREELDVKLGLDVYQFAPSLPFKEGGKK